MRQPPITFIGIGRAFYCLAQLTEPLIGAASAGENVAHREVNLRNSEVAVEYRGLLGCRNSVVSGGFVLIGVVLRHVSVGQCGPGQRELRISLDGFLEVMNRELKSALGTLVPIVTPLKVIAISFIALGVTLGDTLFFSRCQVQA